jgi:N-acetylmuramoyl-L-alanine amidase
MRGWLALAMLAVLAGGRACAADVSGVRVWSGPAVTRVVFELSGPVDHQVFALGDPDRLVIDLPHSEASDDLSLPEARGLVAALRTGDRPDGTLRIVLDLQRTAKAKTFLLAPSDEHGHRLVVDLAEAEGPTVVRHAPMPAAGRDLVVAIDAGHGGDDPGATGPHGAHEKDVVLAIARALAKEIEAEPGMHAVLTRNGDYFVSLRKRTEIAHAAKADFFISVHADSYRDSSANGATVYVLSEKGASDEAALLLAQRENAADLIGGVSLADKDQLLAKVLLDLSQNAALSASTAAGQRLIRRMGTVIDMRRTRVQRAPFLVLKSPDIPSVLVETAYISNTREERELRSAQFQSKLADALHDGIVDYFVANPPPGSYFAAHLPQRPVDPVRHVITRGETLSEIAERYRISTATLRRSNRLKTDLVKVGQVLLIPPG